MIPPLLTSISSSEAKHTPVISDFTLHVSCNKCKRTINEIGELIRNNHPENCDVTMHYRVSINITKYPLQ